MTTSDVVVDVSQDWLQACSVQGRSMRGPAGNDGQVDYSARLPTNASPRRRLLRVFDAMNDLTVGIRTDDATVAVLRVL